jgi:hypothetical protein
MTPFVTAGAGFLLAVLWFDLMFDVQVRAHDGPELPEETLRSIAAYYRRVTTTARPMNRLIATVMPATLAAIITEIAQAHDPVWIPWASLALAAGAIGRAGARTVPNAQRLGQEKDTREARSNLARSIYHDHLLCFGAITTVLVLQLAH